MGRDRDFDLLAVVEEVSIHAPRVGRDTTIDTLSLEGIVSIHAPRVGRDIWAKQGMRRPNVSIHAPRVGRDQCKPCILAEPQEFQSTRPVWGATTAMTPLETAKLFQSTRPVWGATEAAHVDKLVLIVSIHAPRVGRDVRF